MLERGAAARYAAPAFYRNYNDFDVYIEDTAIGYDKIFASLLGRSISNRLTINRVFPLGSRPEVLKAAELETQAKPNRRSVFIVDGDLYLLCGESGEIPSNVVVLPRYCIENFLCDEEALVLLMDEEAADIDAQTLTATLDLPGWVKRAKTALHDLFKIFAVAHRLQSGIPTISRGSKCICASYDGEIDPVKAKAIFDEIHNTLCNAFGVVIVEYWLRVVDERIDSSQCFVSTYVSGKDFVLPLIIQRVRSITKTKSPNINLKLRLARHCSVSPMADIVVQIAAIIGCADLVPDQ